MRSPSVPNQVWLYRLIHVDNLETLLRRGALLAPNATPDDGLPYRTIHSRDVQANRHAKVIRCGPGGTAHDYIPFYFGPHSVMLLNLKTGRVAGYAEGQAPLVYLVTSVATISKAGIRFVFSDGHGLAGMTRWFDRLEDLDQVDWPLVVEKFWADNRADNDRQRRKQAEFLVHYKLDWSLIRGIAVYDDAAAERVEGILQGFPGRAAPKVAVKREYYY